MQFKYGTKAVKRFYPLPAIAALALVCSSIVFANTELYQWVDENGVKHFSQQPPAHIPDLKPVDVHGTPAISGDERRPQVSTSGQQSPDPGGMEKGVMPEEFEAVEKNQANCEAARQNRARIEGSGRMRQKDSETGEVRYLSEEEKASLLKQWIEAEQTHC